jgi:hypothetical protein
MTPRTSITSMNDATRNSGQPDKYRAIFMRQWGILFMIQISCIVIKMNKCWNVRLYLWWSPCRLMLVIVPLNDTSYTFEVAKTAPCQGAERRTQSFPWKSSAGTAVFFPVRCPCEKGIWLKKKFMSLLL